MIGGKALVGAIVWMPPPGMSKFTKSNPVVAFVVWIAARRLHCEPTVAVSTSQIPLPGLVSGSSVLILTIIGVRHVGASNFRISALVKPPVPPVHSPAKQENSLVLPSTSVAVAVIFTFGATGTLDVNSKPT